MADMKNGSSSTKTEGSMTKKEAVERGLKTLGSSATPTQLQKHIREQYKIEMDLKHISTAKAKIIKATGQSKPAVAKPTSTTLPVPQAMSQGKGPHGIHLRDIETVKELVERVGATSLKKLIDVMAR
jgi:hypothetical protein